MSIIANTGPPMAVPLFSLPLIASLFSFGIALILIIILEAFILYKRESIKLTRAVRLITEANLFSTLVGFGIVIFLIGLPSEKNLIFWGIFLLFFLLIGICTSSFLRRLTPFWSGHFIFWSLVWFLIMIGELLLLGLINNIFYKSELFFTIFKLLGVTIYFSVGFLLSVIVEGFWIAYRLSKTSFQNNHFTKTIIIMNLRSYLYVAIPIILIMIYRINN